MPFNTEAEAIAYIFRSKKRLGDQPRGFDENTRDISNTRKLITLTDALAARREYAVVTGSKGKGSVAAITAKLLQHLGHTVGLITSPHLVHWYERIRVNGKMIPQSDFLRILSELEPYIDQVEAGLTEQQYISPQGIFLLIALHWFDEMGVDAAVVEVGRGGRFDDMSLVPNMVSLFTPILMEHAQYLGDSLERIAWHKAGIIKAGSYVYSVPQEKVVLDMIQREADSKDAEFFWISSLDMGEYLGDTENGIRMRLHRYGEVEVSLHGRYQVANATLAVQAAGNMHSRLKGISHSSDEYVQCIKAGLADVRWFGRMQKLEENPAIYVDGAINTSSVKSLLESIEGKATSPLIIIAGVPKDRDYPAVYSLLAEKADTLILTDTDIHPNIHFPDEETAIAAAKEVHSDAIYGGKLPNALEIAREKAGTDGTILMAVAQPLVGEAMLIWEVDVSEI